MKLIDEDLTRDQFEFLGPDSVQRLLDAIHNDLRRWEELLRIAWETGDEKAIHLARHSIRGLCSNFGAEPLHRMAEADLTTAESREAFRALRDDTLKAIREVAGAR